MLKCIFTVCIVHCFFRRWMVMLLYILKCLLALYNVKPFANAPLHCSVINSHRIFSYVTRCFALLFLPSVCPVRVKFSQSFYLIMFSRCLFPILSTKSFLPIFPYKIHLLHRYFQHPSLEPEIYTLVQIN